ncbi:MAG: transposase family protein [Pseudonocardiaceae bacterium]
MSGPWRDRRHSARARHGSRFTSAFEDTAAWLACHAAFSVLAALLRITWRSVAAVITRVLTSG